MSISNPQISGSMLDPEGVITKPRAPHPKGSPDVHPDSMPDENRERTRDNNISDVDPKQARRLPGKDERLSNDGETP